MNGYIRIVVYSLNPKTNFEGAWNSDYEARGSHQNQ
jgi:hypothetical protein